MSRLNSNFESVQQRVADAAIKSGRTADDVTLIGVTKYVDVETTRALFEAGCVNLGESRPQVLWEKSEKLDGLPICWHMIGHLQRNKMKRTINRCSLIHSGDSHRLMTGINKEAESRESPARVLLEVNVSGEESKYGYSESDLPDVLDLLSDLPNVKVDGLMCMAGLAGNDDDARREFAKLRSIRDKYANNCPDNVELKELSMGMSGDFEIAIEEGATMVRVGSLLFAGV